MVEVRIYATLSEIAGRKRLTVEGVKTVGELLDELYRRFPAFKKELEGRRMILVNGHNVEHLNGLETPVGEDDVVSIFPPAGGG